MTDPDALADALYAAPPAGFVAARDRAVATARAAGDGPTATALAGLRRPSVGAWLVNLLAISRPDLIADFTALAAPLRDAQSARRGDDLRALSARRRAAISALVDEVRTLARAADPTAAKLPLAEVEATLSAALAGEAAAAAVASGRLVKSISYAGFGEPPLPDLAGPAPARTAALPTRAQPAARRARSAAREAGSAAREAESAARAAVEAATAAERGAAAALADAAARAAAADQAAAALDEAIAAAEHRLAALRQELTARKADRAAARAAAHAAAKLRSAAESALATRARETHEAQERLFATRRH